MLRVNSGKIIVTCHRSDGEANLKLSFKEGSQV